jgi:hypothetical protein
VIYVYAFLDADGRVPPCEGLDGEPLEERALSGLTVAVGVRSGRAQATQEAVLRHGAVVDALARENDAVLPARFGTCFAGPELLAGEVSARADELRRALDGVRGCVEMGIRVSRLEERPADPAASGRDYLEARLAAMQEAERVHRPLAACARESVRRSAASPDVLFNGAYLVESQSVPRFLETAADVGRAERGVAVLATGPWAPYSFAEDRP